jgi:hypothetical protein
VTVIPGYDDRNTGRPPPRPVTDHWGGETYRGLWQEAIGAVPDCILITSWNEWHEGSELEPSVEDGSPILDETTTFSREFLARQRVTHLQRELAGDDEQCHRQCQTRNRVGHAHRPITAPCPTT